MKDIIAELNSKGLLHKGKPFAKNTVYNILANERYSGIYHYNGEEFDNIYPQIVPNEVFEIVQKKVRCNKYGKRSNDIVYLLKDKVKCGYCGKSIIGRTAQQGMEKESIITLVADIKRKLTIAISLLSEKTCLKILLSKV